MSVDRQSLPRNVAAGFGAKKKDEAGNLIRLNQGSHGISCNVIRVHLFYALPECFGIGFHHSANSLAFYLSRADCVHADSKSAQLHRESLGQADDRPFRGHIR